MAIELYEHNRIAYEKSLRLLATEGKAAVVHPTGTGKSFIAFQLCADNPTKKVLWLSPSEYIFKTQLECVKKQGFEPKNISFYTYAKLTFLSDEEMRVIRPDYIILDEFHRAGAQAWGKNVGRLLRYYKNTPVLGLSATNIRYLDNQRDMADELFDGVIASYMTLGEAIVRGILLPPVYVTAVYSCQKELQKYEKRVRAIGTKAIRDPAEVYLDKLRRAMEKADGLDEIFGKHIPAKNGKYIVFCPDFSGMGRLKAQAKEMFYKIDPEPHVYGVYSDDPETDKEFAAFKADESDHLKLLYCIDMLNEGVHVSNVDGVILFRPTVSPIVYKQQIGRALSANKDRQPIIFDIVNNFENLYAISSIKKEMDEAVNYYRTLGEYDMIVNERFTVIDEVKECRRLFHALEDSLTIPWERMFEDAKAYKNEFGDLNVPKRYKTEKGYALGAWLCTQRRVYAGKSYGILTEEQIERLDSIGMIWESETDARWNTYYHAAEAYRREHGDLIVPSDYSENGILLGKWLGRLRTMYKKRQFGESLSPAHIRDLESIGMCWDLDRYEWECNFAKAKEFYEKNGHLNVPPKTKLSTWIGRQRRVYAGKVVGAASLTKGQIQKLESIGIKWDSKSDISWFNGYREAVGYFNDHGNLVMATNYVSPDGFKLGQWLNGHRLLSNGKTVTKVTPKRKALLDELGFIWDRDLAIKANAEKMRETK